jgi:hypothetical protein
MPPGLRSGAGLCRVVSGRPGTCEPARSPQRGGCQCRTQQTGTAEREAAGTVAGWRREKIIHMPGNRSSAGHGEVRNPGGG